jgi:HTH-type transcriptional regulator/antitoxin HigA
MSSKTATIHEEPSDDQVSPADDFPVSPGDILKEELEARGWTQIDLATVMGRPTQAISEIISAAKQVTPQTALELAQALGTTAELWTNLEADYRLALARSRGTDSAISVRARLFGLAPVRELIKRGWIAGAGDLETELCTFLEIPSIWDSPQTRARLRASVQRGPEEPSVVAWLKRVEWLASRQPVSTFDAGALDASLDEIAASSVDPSALTRLPATLAQLGIHFVIVPHLPKTFLDGATFWLDDGPVVAMTLRYDRTDSFWFTLMHELGHVLLGHAEGTVDQVDLEGETEPIELEANAFATDRLLVPARLRTLADSLDFAPSMARVESAASELRRHPSILIGHLHHTGVLGYGQGRNYLVKVSPYLVDFIDRPVAA